MERKLGLFAIGLGSITIGAAIGSAGAIGIAPIAVFVAGIAAVVLVILVAQLVARGIERDTMQQLRDQVAQEIRRLRGNPETAPFVIETGWVTTPREHPRA